MQSLAENWLVLALTGSATFLGLDAFLQQLPIMLFTLIGGVLADRLDRRRTLLMSQYVQITTAVTLAFLVYFGYIRVWHILMLSFVTGCAQAFGGPAYQSLIPSLVDKRDLTNAIALNSISSTSRARSVRCLPARCSRSSRPGVQRFKPASHGRLLHAERAVVSGGDLRAHLAPREAHPPLTTRPMLDELRSGLRYVRDTPAIPPLIVLASPRRSSACRPDAAADLRAHIYHQGPVNTAA